MTWKLQRNSGQIYKDDEEDQKEILKNRDLILKYNSIKYKKAAKRDKLIRKILGEAGDNLFIASPFFCDFGYNIHLGDNVFLNYNVCILDCGEVFIGDNVLIAPNVGIYTVWHMLDSEQRRNEWAQTAPVKIGNNVWIGANAIILPGVSIGSNSVIGAGSLVTKDIPEGVLAFGNPCKVIRKITEKDKKQVPLI